MSLHEDEDGTTPSSDSFWEIGQYKRTVRRIDDGLALCTGLMNLIRERGEIEAAYAKSLKTWSAKWTQQNDKGPEYGSMQTAFRHFLQEADEKCKLHTRIRDRLTEEVFNTLKLWSKENYHQKALSGVKESKEIDEALRKAQKPWAKLYIKTDKLRKDYHQACKIEKTAINQATFKSIEDSSISPDAKRKLSDKVDKCKEECDKSRDLYEKVIVELTTYNGKYMEDMSMVFEKCQEMEQKRLKFFKEMLLGIHKCLDISQDPKLSKIYKDCWTAVESADAQQDLRWWAHNFGTGMSMSWPVFEEYTPEMRRIANGKKSTLVTGGQPVVLTKQRITEPDTSVGIFGQRPTSNGNAHEKGPKSPNTDGNSPFDDDWDVGPDGSLVYCDKGGVQVKALYDYVAQEGDELALDKGELFEKLEDEDEQGWCKGRKDGKIGLYPANYAIAI